ncbi:triple tyrosine motif-containing protein [Prevotella sp. 10(H)]|uniref:triple tyrosine motif-containing protein n=1 Tax=Prevotella sp. 10(H) TaxID=1158294 RepID=UPI0009DE47CA|nr:triple tyrosine motif-containing protein [Prevotella sp. 10(H)]
MRNIIILILFFFSLLGHSSPVWQRRIVNYERNQYKAGFQNWMIDQSEKGWIYCANSNGLLEFDAVHWTLYAVKNRVLRSLKIVGNRIYVGGSSEFGYFEPDNTGLLIYKSLSEKTKHIGEVWNIVVDKDLVYYVSDKDIHVYDQNIVETIRIDKKIDCSELIGNRIYIGTPAGVFYLDSDKSPVFVESCSQLLTQKLVSILPYENKILVTTARMGMYLLDDNGIQKVQSIADDFIKETQLFSVSILDSKIALGSVQHGVFLFDMKDPAYKEIYNLDNGLKNNTVLRSFFDKDQNLWLGLDKGLSLLDMNSPIRPLFATVSPIGVGYCSQVFNDDLYLGTNQGLYTIGKDGKYRLIKGSEGQIWSMMSYDNSLFCSGDNGIMVISKDRNYKIDMVNAWETHPVIVDEDKMIAGTYFGLNILKKKGNRWYYSHRIENFTNSGRGFIQDDVDPYSFWIANSAQNVQKIKFDNRFEKIINQKTYLLGDSKVEGNVFFRRVDKNLIICGQDGIYQYSYITDSFSHYTELESMLEGAQFYEYLYVDKMNNIWYVHDKKLKYKPCTPEGYTLPAYDWGLSDELIINHENVQLLDSETAIVSIDNGFVKIDISKANREEKPLNVFIKKFVSNRNDSVISYGKPAERITLPYSQNSLSIHFAATDYSGAELLYSYRLKELDEEWSIPSPITMKEYTNLHEGIYTFEVKAIKGKNEISQITGIEFRILPPWYRSAFAYIFYLLIIVALFFLLYKKTISKQKKIIREKGEELIYQSKRHAEENKIKDQEIYELQNENLKTELHYKTQELNGYILNIIRKNEMLEDVKKNAVSISKAIDEEKDITTIRQKVVRLISQINSNIEKDSDFEVFQSNFDIIHQDFFKLLDEKFPGLTRNDKILCAYLNMNLSTKEIAPLLNISIRGVEVNRYRLRKKMNLDRDVNLSDFLRDMK